MKQKTKNPAAFRMVSPETANKHRVFATLLNALSIYIPDFTYIDLNAGPGLYPAGCAGKDKPPRDLWCASLGVLKLKNSRTGRYLLIDQDKVCISHLTKHVAKFTTSKQDIRIIQDSNAAYYKNTLRCINKEFGNRSGLILADPMPGGKEEFPLLVKMSKNKHLKKLDIFVHFMVNSGARSWARFNRMTADQVTYKIERNYKLITIKAGIHGHCFMFCTNDAQHANAIENLRIASPWRKFRSWSKFYSI